MASNKKTYMVYGGEFENVKTRQFKDNNMVQVIGLYENYEDAFKAWRGAAQKTVDNAQMRFFIVEVTDVKKTATG